MGVTLPWALTYDEGRTQRIPANGFEKINSFILLMSTLL